MSEPENLIGIEGAESTRMSPSMGVAMIALNMAFKYHDITTIQDGTLYQQYKLEGKNMIPLHLDEVFETARQIERHLLTSSRAITEMLVTGLFAALEATAEDGAEDEAEAPV